MSDYPPLTCPEHHLPLAYEQNMFVCGHGHRFEVREDIPRLVQSNGAYTDAFGEQWNRYRTTQLDSYTLTTISEDRIRRCIGPALWKRLHGQQVVDVLETGCGAGRFTEVLLRTPASRVTSTDLSSAVDANRKNCPISNRHRIIQCDLYRLPFPPGSFEMVVCLGVLQHTPDPDAAIACLYAQLRPGGSLIIDHYTRSLAQSTKVTANMLRPFLKRLPPKAGLRATDALTKTFFPLHRAARRSLLLQHVISRFSPLLTYYHEFPQLTERLQYEWALLDTHDSLTDYYKHFRSPQQIHRILARLGAADIHVQKAGNGVEARCRKR